MNYNIGIDLGGTNVRVAKISENGQIIKIFKEPIVNTDNPQKIIAYLLRTIHKLPEWAECSAVGIGVPAPVDVKNNIIPVCTNIPGLANYPISQELSLHLGMPVYIENDANVAGLAESIIGSGKGYDICYYVTLSTGIGGSLIINKKIILGKHGFGGEIANIIIDRNRHRTNYLNIGAIDNEASGSAITRKWKNLYPSSNVQNAHDIFSLIKKKQPEAISFIDNVAKDLGQLFATIACVCDPDIFIIGGGMVQSADYFVYDTLQLPKKSVRIPLNQQGNFLKIGKTD